MKIEIDKAVSAPMQKIGKEYKVHNYLLDVFKVFSAISVVFFHINFPSPVGKVIFTFAVPLFFMISGFYSYKAFLKRNSEYFKRKFIQTLKLYIICSVLYFAFYMLRTMLTPNITVKGYLVKRFKIDSIVYYFLFNKQITDDHHLWFMLALIYIYGLMYFLTKLNKPYIYKNKTIIAVMILLIVGGLGADIFMNITNMAERHKAYFCLTRNWLFYGSPCFLIGYLLKIYEEKIKNIELKRLIFLSILLIAAFYICRFVMLNTTMFSFMFRSDISCFIIGFSASLIAIALKYSEIVPATSFTKKLSLLSTYIYVLHWAVIDIVRTITDHFFPNHSDLFAWINPILVLAITIIVSLICMTCVKKIRGVKKNGTN